MKTTHCLFTLVIGSLLALGGAGCHKNGAVSAAPPKTLEEGLVQLQAALTTASPQAQSNFYSGVSYDIRYGFYDKAATSLQQIANDPTLNDQQKKLVADVGDLLKQKATGQPNAPKSAP